MYRMYRARRAFGDAATTNPASAPTSTQSLSDLVNSPNVSTASAALMVYHGYARTGSFFWGLMYGLAGKLFPLEVLPIAIAQGFGKKKECR